MKALIAVAAKRSYSPLREETSCEQVTCTPGAMRRTASATRRSCSGLATDHSRQTAIELTPASTSSRTRASTSASSSATTSCPAASTRSFSSRISERSATGRGLAWREACSIWSTGRPLLRPLPRMTGSVSRWPRLVSTPTFAPRSSTTALVATVVPCRTISQSRRNSSAPMPCSPASLSTPSMNPRSNRGGVEETLVERTRAGVVEPRRRR